MAQMTISDASSVASPSALETPPTETAWPFGPRPAVDEASASTAPFASPVAAVSPFMFSAQWVWYFSSTTDNDYAGAVMAEYLKYGALGFGALILGYAVILLRQELAKAQPQAESKKTIWSFMGFGIALLRWRRSSSLEKNGWK